MCGVEERRNHPLKGGWSHNLPVGEGGDVVFCLVWCWRVSAWCWGMGVVEGYCCFCVVERFLEGRGEFEFVVGVYSFVNFFCRNVRRDIG